MAGHRIQLIHWLPRRALNESERNWPTRTAVDSLVTLPRANAFSGLFNSFHTPLWCKQFSPSREIRVSMLEAARKFQSEIIWVEGPWSSGLAIYLSKELGIPLLYRSQNIEYQYMKSQIDATLGKVSQFRLKLLFSGIENFELNAMKHSSHIFDISCDDLLWWRERGIINNSWLPPLTESSFIAEMNQCDQDIDVLFLGNLVSPNNLAGINWLVNEVWPIIKRDRPETNLTIAGSSPSKELSKKLAAISGITLIANVPNATDVMRRAKVMVNPVRTGSGIQLKMIEMLSMPGMVVSSNQGGAGMPEDIRTLFKRTDDTNEFAFEILSSLAHPMRAEERRDTMKKRFAPDRVVSSIINVAEAAVQSHRAN